MSKELIENYTKNYQWTVLNNLSDLQEFANREGEHVIFLVGDIARNLESADVAVILPEIAQYFQRRFDIAIASEEAEAAIKDYYKSYKTPNLIFVRGGDFLGAIPKVRDWDDYITRTTHILNKSPQAVN